MTFILLLAGAAAIAAVAAGLATRRRSAWRTGPLANEPVSDEWLAHARVREDDYW
jgi:hypothetical protein